MKVDETQLRHQQTLTSYSPNCEIFPPADRLYRDAFVARARRDIQQLEYEKELRRLSTNATRPRELIRAENSVGLGSSSSSSVGSVGRSRTSNKIDSGSLGSDKRNSATSASSGTSAHFLGRVMGQTVADNLIDRLLPQREEDDHHEQQHKDHRPRPTHTDGAGVLPRRTSTSPEGEQQQERHIRFSASVSDECAGSSGDTGDMKKFENNCDWSDTSPDVAEELMFEADSPRTASPVEDCSELQNPQLIYPINRLQRLEVQEESRTHHHQQEVGEGGARGGHEVLLMNRARLPSAFTVVTSPAKQLHLTNVGRMFSSPALKKAVRQSTVGLGFVPFGGGSGGGKDHSEEGATLAQQPRRVFNVVVPKPTYGATQCFGGGATGNTSVPPPPARPPLLGAAGAPPPRMFSVMTPPVQQAYATRPTRPSAFPTFFSKGGIYYQQDGGGGTTIYQQAGGVHHGAPVPIDQETPGHTDRLDNIVDHHHARGAPRPERVGEEGGEDRAGGARRRGGRIPSTSPFRGAGGHQREREQKSYFAPVSRVRQRNTRGSTPAKSYFVERVMSRGGGVGAG